MNIEIRKVSASEHYLITDMFDKYRIFYKQESNKQLANDFIKQRLENEESVIFLATNSETFLPVGFTQLYPRPSSIHGRMNWHLGDIYVEESARKNGIGAKLLRMAETFARGENSGVLTLNTGTDNTTAQSIYEANGYKRKEYLEGYFHYQLDLE